MDKELKALKLENAISSLIAAHFSFVMNNKGYEVVEKAKIELQHAIKEFQND